MINKLAVMSVKVLDLDEALDFYVNKLGLEVGNDIKQGTYRWLTVRYPATLPPKFTSTSQARRCKTRPRLSSFAS